MLTLIPMKKFRRLKIFTFLGVLLIIFFYSLSLKSQTIDEVINHIQIFYNKIETIQASFIQEVYFPQGGKEVSYGKFYIKKPGKFRFEYLQPQNFQIISKGQIIYFYYPKEKQALVYPSNKTLGSNLAMGFMTGKGSIKNDLKVESFRILESNFWEIHFLPISKDPRVQKIILVVNPNSGEVKEFTVINTSGEKVRILLKNIKYNLSLPNSLFEFSPPKDVKVLNAF